MNRKEVLDKISEASSPDASYKAVTSPMRNPSGKIMVNGFGNPCLAFYMIDSKNEYNQSKAGLKSKNSVNSTETLAEKDQKIQKLQETIMSETVKKNARERCFEERTKTNWKPHLPQIFTQIVKKCISFSKNSPFHQRRILKLVHRSSKASHAQKCQLILGWVLEWIRAIFLMLADEIKKAL